MLLREKVPYFFTDYCILFTALCCSLVAGASSTIAASAVDPPAVDVPSAPGVPAPLSVVQVDAGPQLKGKPYYYQLVFTLHTACLGALSLSVVPGATEQTALASAVASPAASVPSVVSGVPTPVSVDQVDAGPQAKCTPH